MSMVFMGAPLYATIQGKTIGTTSGTPGGTGGVVVTDNFNTADYAGIGADTTWTMYEGQFKTVSNHVEVTTINANTRAVANTSTTTQAMYARATVTQSVFNSSNRAGVHIRCDPSLSTYYFLEVSGTVDFTIGKMVNNVLTTLVTGTSQTRPSPCTVELQANGPEITALINGSVVSGTQDTDAAITGTRGGIRAFVRFGATLTSEVAIDDFITGPLSSSTTPTPVTDPAPPQMPATSKDSTWSLVWSQDFNTDIAVGGVMASTSPYQGTATANDIGIGKFFPYTYPAYKDTRNKHKRTITITTVSGSAVVTSSAAFILTGGDTDYAGKYLHLAGTTDSFSPPTQFSGTADVRIVSIADTSTMTVSRAATTSGTFSVVIRHDFGYYDEKAYSVSNGRLRLHESTTSADGRHHVGALCPKINYNASGSQRDVLGGRFSICMRVPAALSTYKIAYLLWPQSNVSNPDGEIDFPEQDLVTGVFTKTFMHWQVTQPSDVGQQSSATSTVDVVDTNWHTYVIEWRPNHTTPANSTLKTYADGTLVGNFSGIHVPNTAMHWTWQNETFLDFSQGISNATDGYVEVAWGTFENMI